MKIAFFTEMPFNGKVPRTQPNMRTEFAWMVGLGADHYNLNDIPEQYYQLGIVITPKNSPESVDLSRIKNFCKIKYTIYTLQYKNLAIVCDFKL